jgi:hypothetical protein
MNEEFQNLMQAWQQSVSLPERRSVMLLGIYLVMGGALSLYLRWLYGRFGSSASDSQAITRVFPLLTIVTTAVIAVVKSSLALSLGLVGALSIVRFRAAIKEPEELVYLFLCIAVGLSLGAEKPLLALALVIVATVFVVIMHQMGVRASTPRTLLTITGDSDRYFQPAQGNALSAISEVTGRYTIQRLDIADGQGQVRIVIPRSESNNIDRLVSDLRQRLPECEFSFINLDSAI